MSDNPAKSDNKDVRQVNTVIVGGGQAGLAMSRCLMDRGVTDHIILERGRLVERWRSQRWDSLRLLTPNWQTRLPGNFCYHGDDPDGFMTAAETVQFFEEYASSFAAPILTGMEVVQAQLVVEEDQQLLRIQTSQKVDFMARNMVIATGFCDKPRIPAFARSIPADDVTQITANDYKRPSQLPSGNVLIVGASATGAQIAQELLDYNELHPNIFPEITISVGNYTRAPRKYRGKDIVYWMDAIGFFQSSGQQDQERLAPAPQIIGTPEHSDLDLNILQQRGVRLVGRVCGLKTWNGMPILEFNDDLQQHLACADERLSLVLGKIDSYIEANAIRAPPATKNHPITIADPPLLEMCLQEGIQTILWATGFDREYPWLQTNNLSCLLDKNGEVLHEQGVTPQDGVYVLGMRFQRTKSSNLIDGVGPDAAFLADRIVERNSAVESSA